MIVERLARVEDEACKEDLCEAPTDNTVFFDVEAAEGNPFGLSNAARSESTLICLLSLFLLLGGAETNISSPSTLFSSSSPPGNSFTLLGLVLGRGLGPPLSVVPGDGRGRIDCSSAAKAADLGIAGIARLTNESLDMSRASRRSRLI